MTKSDLQSWLDRYVLAWRANSAAAIEELFTEDATYRWHPYDEGEEMAIGREGIVAAWLEEPDDPDMWEAIYEVWALDGDRGVGVGTTRYLATADEAERTYHNCFLMRFAEDGRCSEFTEYFMSRPG
jgi:ketosteroid isomerase-like protein